MSEKNAPPEFDPDATTTGPLVAPDPDATVTLKGTPLSAPDQDPTPQPVRREPELKLHPALKDSDPEATINPAPPVIDPDATFSGPMSEFDPDATVSGTRGARRRSNPFAPKALPEALQANLAALGGLNPLIAFANPILSAIPQIGAARSHPDPTRLKETLQDLIEAFEAGASKSGVSDETLEGAVYALCCLADDSAAATPWGQEWRSNGLLKEMRGETNGGEEFFALLEASKQKPDEKADLLEFLYICLALGFQGRYRTVKGAPSAGGAELDRVRAELHALVTRRRARPDGLSRHWRPAVASAGTPDKPRPAGVIGSGEGAGPFPWRAAAAAVFALLVLFAGYRALNQPAPPAVSMQPTAAPPITPPPTAIAAAPAPAPVGAPAALPAAAETSASVTKAGPAIPAHQVLEQELAGEIKAGRVAIAQDGGRTTITLRNDRQFASGTTEPSAEVQAVIGRIAAALDRAPGPILVRGYADSVPLKTGQFASNRDLSAARAKAAAVLIAARLGQQRRITSEGAGEADPIAPNDTEDNRARNRRVAIILGPLT